MAIFKKRNTTSTREYRNMVNENAELIIKAIIASMDCGYIVSFGRTRDGKSILLSVYDGEDTEKVYAGTNEELAELLEELAEKGGNGDEDDATPARNNSTRRRGKTGTQRGN